MKFLNQLNQFLSDFNSLYEMLCSKRKSTMASYRVQQENKINRIFVSYEQLAFNICLCVQSDFSVQLAIMLVRNKRSVEQSFSECNTGLNIKNKRFLAKFSTLFVRWNKFAKCSFRNKSESNSTQSLTWIWEMKSCRLLEHSSLEFILATRAKAPHN